MNDSTDGPGADEAADEATWSDRRGLLPQLVPASDRDADRYRSMGENGDAKRSKKKRKRGWLYRLSFFLFQGNIVIIPSSYIALPTGLFVVLSEENAGATSFFE